VPGADEGFEQWYRDAHPRVLATTLLVSGRLDDAADATDEAFMRALVAWDRVAGMRSPTGWACTVALNHLRRRARRRQLEERLLRRLVAPDDVPAAAIEAWDAVRALPSRQRQALVLRYVADLPEADVARAMGVRRGTASATLSAARRALAGLLAEPSLQGDAS
jgi:RNA polymerase sigma-70 factor (ECF subfamily)